MQDFAVRETSANFTIVGEVISFKILKRSGKGKSDFTESTTSITDLAYWDRLKYSDFIFFLLVSKDNSSHLMKVTAKRRRSKAQIKEER